MTIDFIGIGTPKAASTWVFQCLSEHPQVCGSSEKEICFFDNPFNFKKGLDWYFSFFKHAKPGQILGEFSPPYIYKQETAEKIKNTFPHTKLIITFRNPIEKLYSMFWYNKIGGRGSMALFDTFEDALAGVPGMKENALHAQQFSHYVTLFPKNQIHIIFYDDVLQDPEKVLSDTYKFLGIDESFIAPSARRDVNETGNKRIRFPVVFKMIYKIYWNIKKIHWLWAWIKKHINTAKWSIHLGRIFSSYGGKKIKKPPMNPDTKENLKKFFKQDIELLETLTGRDLTSWK
jgi:hypothetical protein